MTSYYESATSGLNFDRFADELPTSSTYPLNSAESTLSKMRQHFWTAKQVLRQKVLRKKEDSFLLASDADFDTKLSRYFSIRNTTREMLAAIEDYHHFVGELVESERDLGDFLKAESCGEKEHLAKVMEVSSACLKTVSKHRQKTIRPLIRLYHDLDVFNERAIADCSSTVEAAERVRMEYRGSLLWIKDTSEELDPNSCVQMDKFRTAQAVVRQNKERFDKLKADTLQKVDLLASSRSRLLVELAREYAKSLLQFYESSSKAYEEVVECGVMGAIDTYEIDILKILNDPVGLAIEKQKEEKRLAAERRKVERELRERRRSRRQQRRRENASKSEEEGDSGEEDEEGMIELDEIEEGQVVTDMQTVEDEPLPLLIGWTDDQLESGESIKSRRAKMLLAKQDEKDLETEKNAGHPKSTGNLFRVESPLGILDDSKFEDEEVGDDGHKEVLEKTLIEVEVEALGASEIPPKLKPPPSNGLINRSAQPDLLLNMEQMPSTIPSTSSGASNQTGFWNPFSNNSPTKGVTGSADGKATDWTSLLMEEMDQTKSADFANTTNSLLM